MIGRRRIASGAWRKALRALGVEQKMNVTPACHREMRGVESSHPRSIWYDRGSSFDTVQKWRRA
jgi:hypothetical protein